MTDTCQQLLSAIGLPPGDLHGHPTSDGRFSDGGQYRIEIPAVEGLEAATAVLDQAARLDVPIHRMSSGSGIALMTDDEIRDLAQLGFDAGVEICPFVGPKAPWDGDSAAALAPDGRVMGWRHAGMDQLLYALRDVDRATRLGIRSVLLADEGLIDVVARGRELGHFPADLVIKGSALLGIGNAAALRLLRGTGLDSMNVPGDLSLAKLAAVRSATDLMIDLYIESPDSLGGFLRYHEVAEIVRVASPVYLKFGLRNAGGIYPSGAHLMQLATSSARERVRRARIGIDHLQRSSSDLILSGGDPHRRGVPSP